MEPEGAGGELVCFLSELDSDGAIPDPRQLIRLRGPAPSGWEGYTVYVGPSPPAEDDVDEWISTLAPRQGEGLDAYQARLAEPECRTAAWRIALGAQDRPVIVLAGPEVPQELATYLVEYLRELIS